jgi:hypothetical protein
VLLDYYEGEEGKRKLSSRSRRKLAFLEKVAILLKLPKDLFEVWVLISKMLTKTTAVGMDGSTLGAKFEAMNLMDLTYK